MVAEKFARSAPVPGRSNFRESCRVKFTSVLFLLDIAAAGDGRTPEAGFTDVEIYFSGASGS
jgi:hypothetical protein